MQLYFYNLIAKIDFVLILIAIFTFIAVDIRSTLTVVAEKIGNDWIKLAAELDSSINTDAIDMLKQTCDEKALAWLLKWHYQYGVKATMDRIVNALGCIDRFDIIDVCNNAVKFSNVDS